MYPRVAKEAVEGAAPKKPSGLTKPMKLSAELSAIVGAGKDEKLARLVISRR